MIYILLLAPPVLRIFYLQVAVVKRNRLSLPAHDGTIAQLVEQRIENPCVPGSNPGSTTEKPAACWLFCFPRYRLISQSILSFHAPKTHIHFHSRRIDKESL